MFSHQKELQVKKDLSIKASLTYRVTYKGLACEGDQTENYDDYKVNSVFCQTNKNIPYCGLLNV